MGGRWRRPERKQGFMRGFAGKGFGIVFVIYIT